MARPLTHDVWIERFVNISHTVFLIFILISFFIFFNRFFQNIKREKLINCFIFILFSAATFITTINHEAWNDEIFAWQLAEAHSIPSLFHEMRYEGHFLPWYLILMPFAKLGFPLLTLNLISWLIAALTALYFIFKAPFSLPAKIAVLCTHGFLYWNPVVARPYVLIPPLLFLLASIYDDRNKKPVIFGILLALLANTHGYIEGFVGIAALLFFIYDVILPWNTYSKLEKKSHLISLVIIAAGIIFAALQVVPSLLIPDKSEAAQLQFKPEEIKYFLTYSVSFIIFAPFLLFLIFFFLIKIFKSEKKLFVIFMASIVYMLFFAVFIYGAGIKNRALLWFWILLFVLWISKNTNLNKSIFLFIICIFLINPSLNVNDIKNDFCKIPAGQTYIKKNITPDTPVFIQKTIFTSTFVYDLNDSYDIYYLENLEPITVFSASKEFNKPSVNSLSDTIKAIESNKKFENSKKYVFIICEWYDSQLKNELANSGFPSIDFSPCRIYEIDNNN